MAHGSNNPVPIAPRPSRWKRFVATVKDYWWLKDLIEVAIACGAVWYAYQANQLAATTAEKQEREAQRREQLEQVKLQVVQQPRYTDNGHTIVEIANSSIQRPALVTRLEFKVSDPEQLRIIEKHRPRKVATAGDPNSVDDVNFTKGIWNAYGDYVFYTSVSLNVRPLAANGFNLGIVDPSLARENRWFRGDLTIDFADIRPGQGMFSDLLEIKNVQLFARAKK